MLLIPNDIIFHGKDQVAQGRIHGVIIKVFLEAEKHKKLKSETDCSCSNGNWLRQSLGRAVTSLKWKAEGRWPSCTSLNVNVKKDVKNRKDKTVKKLYKSLLMCV